MTRGNLNFTDFEVNLGNLHNLFLMDKYANLS